MADAKSVKIMSALYILKENEEQTINNKITIFTESHLTYRTEIARITGRGEIIRTIIGDDRKMCWLFAFYRLDVQIMEMALNLIDAFGDFWVNLENARLDTKQTSHKMFEKKI